MVNARFLPALAAVLLLGLGACGGAAAPPSSSPPAASGKPAASASAKPAASASAKPAASGKPAASTDAKPAGGGALKFAYSVLSVASSPMWTALEEGLFRKEGLNVELTSLESAVLVQSVVSGSVQVATGSTVNAINAQASGADIRSVGTVVQTSSLIMAARPEINTVADLKGKIVGVTQPLSSSDFVTRLILKRNGLVYNKDVQVLTVGTTTAQAASFQANQVQAIVAPLDVITGLPAGGYKVLVNMPEQRIPFSEQSMMAYGPFARANPQAVASAIKAYYEAAQMLVKDYNLFSRVAKKYLQNISDSQLKTGHDNYRNVWTDPANPRVTPASVQTIIELLGESNPKVAGMKYEDVVDNSYVQRLKAAGAFAGGGCEGC